MTCPTKPIGLNINNMLLLIFIVMLGGIGTGLINPAANNAVLDLIPEKVAHPDYTPYVDKGKQMTEDLKLVKQMIRDGRTKKASQ